MITYQKNILIASVFIFICILLSSCKLIIKDSEQTSITVGNIGRNINAKNTLYIQDCYVYQDFDGIYKVEDHNKEKILSLEGTKHITAYEDFVLIKSELENKIYQIGLDGGIKQDEPFTTICDSMYAADGILYCINWKERNVMAYDILNGFSEIAMNDDFFTSEFVLHKPYLDQVWNVKVNNGSTILSTKTDYGSTVDADFAIFQDDLLQPVFYKAGRDSDYYYQYNSSELMYFSRANNEIIKYDINNSKSDSYYYDSENIHGYIAENNILIENRKIIAIAQDAIKKIGHSSKLSEHKKDILLIIDEERKQLKQLETRKSERLLYADSKSAITYYKGKLNTYDVDTWQITKTTDASFITKDNEYYFETCHDKLFVFENGKLIEILDFKELL